MSKFTRNKILSAVSLLEQAEEKSHTIPENVGTLLTNMQDYAIALGTYIESLKGMETQTVPALEKLCEALYGFQSAETEADFQTAFANLNAAMKEVRDKAEEDFPTKPEVVFLPYKASMWDSLEGIWREMSKSGDYETHVIPIPYYDKNPDNTFADFHYEGNDYPEDVPVEDYKAYDLKAIHPDIIYVHNPYDQYNHVTSIPPEYYLSLIRDYTDKLVYVPYFVLADIDPDNQAAVDGMKHFCFVPGTMFAHEVILQSENMRTIYIEEYLKAAKEQGWPASRADCEKRFKGTGSPKVQKAIAAKENKESVQVPEEWKKILYKADGTRKKVIFYNTGVTALLQNDEKMIEKMERAFATFYEYRENVALLWRPHPLIQATIESMRPQLWRQYKKLLDKYISEGWGIYDDTPDMDRAIALADGYYGDGSSIVQLCQAAKVPVMIQNVEI